MPAARFRVERPGGRRVSETLAHGQLGWKAPVQQQTRLRLAKVIRLKVIDSAPANEQTVGISLIPTPTPTPHDHHLHHGWTLFDYRSSQSHLSNHGG